MDDDDDVKGGDRKDGAKLISFPGGKKIDTSSIGAEFVIGQAGHIPTPELEDPTEIEKDVRRREDFVAGHSLVVAVRANKSTGELIDLMLVEMAEETAHLKFEREKVAKTGKSTANYNIARIASLRSLTEMLLKRKEANVDSGIDLKSPRFQKIFQMMMEFFYESMEKCSVSGDIIDLVFKQLKADMKDWEKKFEAAG